MCAQRRRGVPLQYILGTQPFGNLDIKCAPGVLIPRPETEAYTAHLAELLANGRAELGLHARGSDSSVASLNILDFCTGTGCIPLLLYSMLARKVPALRVAGVDISPTALALAQANLEAAIAEPQRIPPPNANRAVSFLRGSVFDRDWISHNLGGVSWDVLTCNPPYVSRGAWKFGRNELSHSTRRYEPKLALVPDDDITRSRGWKHEDTFYAALLEVADLLGPKMLLLEVGDEAQARRILSLAATHPFISERRCELWRDSPDVESIGLDTEGTDPTVLLIKDTNEKTFSVPVRGSGRIRSIVVLPKNPVSG